MTIDEIYFNNDISVRTYNVCKYNGLDSIDKLKEYFLKYNSFKKLRNCGRKSNEELIEIYNKYQTIINNHIPEKAGMTPLEKVLTNINRLQRDVINSYIILETNNLSIRSRNAILKYLLGNLSIRNFAEQILLNKDFIIATVDNVGQKSIPELEIYISLIKDFILNVGEAKDEKQLIALKNNFLIQRTFSISKIPIEILHSESIFQLTDFLLRNNAFFNENQNLIIQKSLKIYQNEKMKTLEEIANENNLSRERVRQIRKDSLTVLFQKLSFIKNFNDDLFKNYGIDISSNIIELKDELVIQINALNKTNFSKEFILYVLAVYLSDKFLIIGNIEDILQPKYSNSRKRHNWNNFYIVNKELSKVDFISFANDLNERINERVEETYFFNFKSYLSRFINDPDIEIIELVFPVAEKILNDEFNIYLDLNDNIVFRRNTIKQAFEYSYEALESLGKPSKVEEITRKIIELYPNYKTDEAKVRASMKRKDGFVPIGRTSVFGLKKWENEIEDFKGGTIRSITIEYLDKFNTPKHISEIVQEVVHYRNETNEKSVLHNLKLDQSNTFVFFENALVGLKSKKYEYVFNLLDEKSVERKSWEERFEDLVSFVEIKGRMPFSSQCSEEEIVLYRWVNVQKNKIKKRQLEKKYENLIKNFIKENYNVPGERKVKLNTEMKYLELKKFIIQMNRLPNSYDKSYEYLYRFVNNQIKLYENNQLNSEYFVLYDETIRLFK